MKKYIFLMLAFVFLSYANSQNNRTGIIYYDHIDNHYSESYNAYLVFNEYKSHFVTSKDSLGVSVNGKTVINQHNDEDLVEVSEYDDVSKTRRHGLEVYLNKATDSMFFTNAFTLTSSLLYGKEKRPNIKWELKEDTKKIGKFTCKKAVTKFRGRTYICWYTEEIPLSYGPWKLQGLPGMILEAKSTDEYFVIQFRKIEYPVTHISVPKSEEKLLHSNKDFMTMEQYRTTQKNEIEKVNNHLKVSAKKYNVRVHPFSELDNFLEVFGDQK
ncbi:GLPGLI family protein [Kordia sp.]|uniref:GLPGLI family protein n=1 Tax=Kordia sp. TaxID=1965332 RepID=UPI003B5BEDCB